MVSKGRAGPVGRRGKNEHPPKVVSVSQGRGFGPRNIGRVLSGPLKTLFSQKEPSGGRKGRYNGSEEIRTELQGDPGTLSGSGGTQG